jgi:hypothetical protein
MANEGLSTLLFHIPPPSLGCSLGVLANLTAVGRILARNCIIHRSPQPYYPEEEAPHRNTCILLHTLTSLEVNLRIFTTSIRRSPIPQPLLPLNRGPPPSPPNLPCPGLTCSQFRPPNFNSSTLKGLPTNPRRPPTDPASSRGQGLRDHPPPFRYHHWTSPCNWSLHIIRPQACLAPTADVLPATPLPKG